jgi:hypothetical protein
MACVDLELGFAFGCTSRLTLTPEAAIGDAVRLMNERFSEYPTGQPAI